MLVTGRLVERRLGQLRHLLTQGMCFLGPGAAAQRRKCEVTDVAQCLAPGRHHARRPGAEPPGAAHTANKLVAKSVFMQGLRQGSGHVQRLPHLQPAPVLRPALVVVHVNTWCVLGSCISASAKAPPHPISSGNVCTQYDMTLFRACCGCCVRANAGGWTGCTCSCRLRRLWKSSAWLVRRRPCANAGARPDAKQTHAPPAADTLQKPVCTGKDVWRKMLQGKKQPALRATGPD